MMPYQFTTVSVTVSGAQTRSRNEAVVAGYDDYVMRMWKHLDVPVRRASDCPLEDARRAVAA